MMGSSLGRQHVGSCDIQKQVCVLQLVNSKPAATEDTEPGIEQTGASAADTQLPNPS